VEVNDEIRALLINHFHYIVEPPSLVLLSEQWNVEAPIVQIPLGAEAPSIGEIQRVCRRWNTVRVQIQASVSFSTYWNSSGITIEGLAVRRYHLKTELLLPHQNAPTHVLVALVSTEQLIMVAKTSGPTFFLDLRGESAIHAGFEVVVTKKVRRWNVGLHDVLNAEHSEGPTPTIVDIVANPRLRTVRGYIIITKVVELVIPLYERFEEQPVLVETELGEWVHTLLSANGYEVKGCLGIVSLTKSVLGREDFILLAS